MSFSQIGRLKLVIIGVLLIIGTVAAETADSSSTISTDKDWVVANGLDQSAITVVAQNSTPSIHSISATRVTFSVDQLYGTMNPLSTAPVPLRGATSIFTPGTKSGTATIQATIVSIDDLGATHSTPLTISQKIDHDLPQFAVFDNPAQLPVGSVLDLHVTLTDRWGNRIDNKRSAENVVLTMSGHGGSGFWDGSQYTPRITAQTDAEGNVSVRIRLSTVAESNYIQMDPIGNIVIPPGTYIEGVADSNPWFISQTIPSPNALEADGVQSFGIFYYVKDRYGNPISGTPINLASTDGMTASKSTNQLGAVWISFGPKDIIGKFTITAKVQNTSAVCEYPVNIGNCSQVVEFYNTEPVDLIVTGSPQGMASLDAEPTSAGTVRARVVDMMGNPVIGENVTFSLGDPSYPGGPYNVTIQPSLSAFSAVVGEDGYATIQFIPGAFTGYGPLDYNETATGTITVTAKWVNRTGSVISRDVVFVWKNYPYLSIYSDATCENVQVGDKVNLTVEISGDGSALRPKPIDVVLIVDRSGSMAGTRLSSAKTAADTFIDNMRTGYNQVGLVSFATTTSTDQTLTTDFNGTKSKVNALVANGGTQMRRALYEAIKDVHDHGRSNAVKAVILLTDGDWNYDGSLIGHGTGWQEGDTSTNHYIFSGSDNEPNNYVYYPGLGGTLGSHDVPDKNIGSSSHGVHNVSIDGEFTGQNMSIYAKNSGIRLYALSFVVQPSTYVRNTLTTMTTNTGGFYEHAPDATQLNALYTRIAGALSETAGGNTIVNLDFGTVKIDDVLSGQIRDYMSYMPDVHTPARPSDSTFITKYNLTHQIYNYSQDDSAAWVNRAITYSVGTIKLNDIWSATFRLNLTKAGTIEMFGPGTASGISFTDASTGKTTTSFIPLLRCRINSNIVNLGFGNKTLRIDHLTATNAGPDPDILNVRWNTTYDGEAVVQETVLYQNRNIPNSHYIAVPGGMLFETKCTECIDQITADTSGWQPAIYSIRVAAVAADAANPASQDTLWEKVNASAQEPIYIKLE